MDSYSPSIDVWSAGCCIAEMWLKKPLFCGDCDYDQMMKIIEGIGSPDKNEFHEFWEKEFPEKPGNDNFFDLFPDDLGDLLKQIIVMNPEKRLTAAEALEHRYFNGISSYLHDICLPECFKKEN